jgi:Icc-related predicted phosphoesterase
MSVDVEIYMTQLIEFFEKNPNDLMVLIGDLQKNEFYQKLRKKCENNFKEGKDIVLSKEQIVETVIELKFVVIEAKEKKKLNKIVQKTSFGDIILN